MPLLYGEEKRAFPRIHGNIVNSTNDTSIFYWILPPIIYGYNYHGVLGQAPTYFSHVDASYIRTNAKRVNFSMNNKAVKRWACLELCPLSSGISYYVLPLQYKHFRTSDISSVGVRLRKVRDSLFLRSDTKIGHSVRPETTSTRSCLGDHHLLLNHHDAIVSPNAQWATRSQRTADDSLMKFMVHSVRLRLQPSSWIRDVWPSSRFDEEDQIYFVSDKDD